ncbi:hypothetical protein [Bhargavaea ginsengi]|nr:hypothetical protein [Bhargavaea ginsengi]
MTEKKRKQRKPRKQAPQPLTVSIAERLGEQAEELRQAVRR